MYQLNPNLDIHDLKSSIETLKHKLKIKVKVLRNEILLLAAKLPEDEKAFCLTQLKSIAGRKAKIQLGDCIACFLRKSKNSYRKMNPILSDGEISHLHQMIGDFLIQSTNANYLSRLLDEIVKVERKLVMKTAINWLLF